MVFLAVLQVVGPMLLEMAVREVAVPAVRRLVRSGEADVPVADVAAAPTADPMTPRIQALSAVQIVSEVPGRMRVEVLGLRGQVELARQIEDAVAALDGVTQAEANAQTGRLLALFDPTQQSAAALVAVIDRARSAHLQQSAARPRHLAAVV